MTKRIILSTVIVLVLAVAIIFAAQFIASDNPDSLIARIINPIAPCACITADGELWWEISNNYMEAYFTPNYGVDRVAQVLYSPGADLYSSENLLFAVTMALADGSGNRIFMVEYGSWEIQHIAEVPDVIGKYGVRAEVVQISGIDGNLLQIHTNDDRIKLITFDKNAEIVGEFEIIGTRRNGELELRRFDL